MEELCRFEDIILSDHALLSSEIQAPTPVNRYDWSGSHGH
jgi:hypothetical protein